MSRSLFVLLAAAVTLLGLAFVVLIVRLLSFVSSPTVKRVALCLLGVYAVALVARPSSWVVSNIAVGAGAIGGVLLLERTLQNVRSVAVFIAIAAVVDLVSMARGPSALLVQQYRDHKSNLLLYLTLTFPVGNTVAPIIGIGDLFVGGAAAAALIRLGVPTATVALAIATGLMAALAYGLWRGGAPALPFVAVSLMVFLWASRTRT